MNCKRCQDLATWTSVDLSNKSSLKNYPSVIWEYAFQIFLKLPYIFLKLCLLDVHSKRIICRVQRFPIICKLMALKNISLIFPLTHWCFKSLFKFTVENTYENNTDEEPAVSHMTEPGRSIYSINQDTLSILHVTIFDLSVPKWTTNVSMHKQERRHGH